MNLKKAIFEMESDDLIKNNLCLNDDFNWFK
jgi:hypothetical protein